MTRSIVMSILLSTFLTTAWAIDAPVETKTTTPPETNTFTAANKPIFVRPSSPTFTLRLSANGNKGAQWFLVDYNTRLVKLLGQQNTAKPVSISAWDFQLQPIAFIAPQVTTITLEYRHAETTKAIKQQTFTVISGAEK